MRVPLRLVALLLFAMTFAGCITATSGPATTADAPPQVACIGDPCARSLDADGGEPWVAVSAVDPDHLVYAVMREKSGQALGYPWMGFGVSRDGGQTWRHHDLPGGLAEPTGPLGAYDFAADPMVAFTTNGTVVVAGLVGKNTAWLCTPLVPSGGPVPSCTQLCPPDPLADVGCQRPPTIRNTEVAVWRSLDGGETFDGGRIVHAELGAHLGLPDVSVPPFGRMLGPHERGSVADKEYLTVDPVTGRLHLAWTQLELPTGRLLAAHSDDDGVTWQGPYVIATGGFGATLAAYDGRVVATYKLYDRFPPQFGVSASADGGATWSPPTILQTMATEHWQAAAVALWAAPEGTQGLIAVPGPDAEGPLALYGSTDGGATWSYAGHHGAAEAVSERDPVLMVDPTSGRGFLAYYGATDGDAAALRVQVAAVDHGTVGAPHVLVHPPVGPQAAFEYFGLGLHPGGAAADVLWRAPDAWAHTLYQSRVTTS